MYDREKNKWVPANDNVGVCFCRTGFPEIHRYNNIHYSMYISDVHLSSRKQFKQ